MNFLFGLFSQFIYDNMKATANNDTGHKLFHSPVEVNGGMTSHVTSQLSKINTSLTQTHNGPLIHMVYVIKHCMFST